MNTILSSIVPHYYANLTKRPTLAARIPAQIPPHRPEGRRQKAEGRRQKAVTACCLLPTAFCLLPTAYCPLPTAHCPLPSAFFAGPYGVPQPEKKALATTLLACPRVALFW